jgi:serine/alanine adding enzyme
MPDTQATANLLAQLKQQKNQKGEIARQFKEVEKGSVAHQQLLEQMKLISAQIDKTTSNLKALEKKRQSLCQTSEEPSPVAFDYLEPQAIWQEQIQFQLTEDKFHPGWKEFLKQHQHTPYHTPEWLSVIEAAFGHTSQLLLAQNAEGKVIGGMPVTFFSSKLFGQFAVAIPFINYGGPVSPYKNVNQKLIEESKKLLEKFQLSHIEVRCIQPDLYPLSTQKKASMILRLPDSDETLDKNLGAKLRSQYKKAEEYRPQLCMGKEELLDDFYQVFARNMRDLGTPVYARDFFATILRTEAIKSHVTVVRLGNRPVSAAFLIGNNNVLEIPWASTIASANKKNMNMWMYRKILSFAISQGYNFFDFGRSTIEAGTYKFKKQWGAEPRQHYWYYLLPEGQQLPEINPNNPKYKLFIALWKLMPVWLSKWIGPLLIKHIP